MNKRLTILSRLWLVSIVLLLACEDQKPEPAVVDELIEDPNANQPFTEDTLSREQIAFLDNLESPPIDFDKILLPNGMTLGEFNVLYVPNGRKAKSEGEESGPQLRKNMIIRDMLGEARRLMTRSSFVKPADPSSKYRPAQPNGLAYGYNLKDYENRGNPQGLCYEEVFGLDCSGFLYHLAIKAGIIGFPVGGSGVQGTASTWNDIFKRDKKFDNLSIKDLGYLYAGELESGDIIVWKGHIGIVAGNGADAFVFQSNGSDAEKCRNKKTGKVDIECVKLETEKNRSMDRGPRHLPITQANDTGWFGEGYKILRIVTDISGEWRLVGRCAGESTDAVNIDIVIPSETDEKSIVRTFTTSGSGTDYDGTVFNVILEGEYNKEMNVMKSNVTFSFPGRPEATRVDGFEVELKMDDTGYFPATKVLSNGGCDIEWRLINKNVVDLEKAGRNSNGKGSITGTFLRGI